MPNDFLEKTLEDIVFENRASIHERGLERFKSKAFRQVILPSGKRIDILGFDVHDGNLKYDLYELKREHITIDSVCQAYNYVEEINHLIRGSFKSCEASIIMIGKKYEPLSILKAVSIPVYVYTYDYKVDGIWFDKKCHSKARFSSHEHFSLGLLAFGTGMLKFANGDVSSVSFHTSILSHLNDKDFGSRLRQTKLDYLIEAEIVQTEKEVVAIIKKDIITETFPVQPAWSVGFYNSIPFEDFFDEFEFELDDSDYEEDELELDVCDLELTGDDEPDSDDEWGIKVFTEPINWHGWELNQVAQPKLYLTPLKTETPLIIK